MRDVIGEVTFSKRFGFMDVGQDDGSFAAIEGALQSAAWIGQVPSLYWIHDFLVPVLGNHLGINARHGRLRKFAAQEVGNRRDRGSDHRDLLYKLVEIQKAKPNEMNDMAYYQWQRVTCLLEAIPLLYPPGRSFTICSRTQNANGS